MSNSSDPSPKITPEILHDLPLQNLDRAAFHFDEFAATLARLIAHKGTRTPLTLGISGTWGTGKTTLLHRLESTLDPTKTFGDPTKPALASFINPHENPHETYRTCRTVWFNAWKYADEDALLVALVRKIVQTMADDGLVNQALGKMLDPNYPRRDVIATVLSWFSIKVKDVGVELNTGEPKETPFAEKTALLDLFDDAFNRLMAIWVHRTLDVQKIDPAQGVLVVFIDDLDRCLPAKAVQVLEAIKLFLDKPGCVFVLAADIEQVERAVMSHYQHTGVLPDEKASDYLEKIIQLRFTLPPISMDKMQTFVNEMEAQDKDGDTPKKLIGTDWGDSWKVLITGAELNPRKVKTILNDLNLQWAMLKNSGEAQGVNRSDFNAWQVLMRIAPRNFVIRVRDQIDDVELRHKFVLEAMEWAKGNQDVAGNYREYDGSYRLKRVLKQMAFSDSFNAARLNDFIHLTAPPVVEPVASVNEAQETRRGGAEEKGIRSGGEGELEGQGFGQAVWSDRGVTPREGVQTWGGLEFVRVPKGRFLMGSKEDNKLAYDQEKPQHPVEIPHDYWIGRYPVTNEQYQAYIQATKEAHPVKDWQKKKDHPVVNVSWQDCMAYCHWLNEMHGVVLPPGFVFRLPTEAEWEKAARGEFGNEWPWGNEWDAKKCNSSEGGPGGTTPVGTYSPQGDSPYGAADMVGNAWEYTHSLWKGFPYKVEDGREDEKASDRRVVRGGSFSRDARYARAAARLNFIFASVSYGFRVCVAPKLSL